ncbi:MAG: CsbD family protein [Edaphobacter sp.]|uniref:CsbD family protein n=1 Tax=Edaphobacter sp. TaxID=1934404 RepID=UPI00239110B9|nr:CsbD family protein [Edaphobacter sp.]MDE1177050.1 CsbD family protein [Edaphobacter sp.]
MAWLLAGGAIGAAVTVLVLNSESEPEYAGGYDSVDRAARKTFGWGVKQRAAGKVGGVVGAVKEGFGRATGDEDLEAEGTVDRVAGKVKDIAGEVGTAAAQTIHDLNR